MRCIKVSNRVKLCLDGVSRVSLFWLLLSLAICVLQCWFKFVLICVNMCFFYLRFSFSNQFYFILSLTSNFCGCFFCSEWAAFCPNRERSIMDTKTPWFFLHKQHVSKWSKEHCYGKNMICFDEICPLILQLVWVKSKLSLNCIKAFATLLLRMDWSIR